MAKFNFPINPNADRENPFEGEHGANPFGDDSAHAINETSPPPAAENLYEAHASSAFQPNPAGDYEKFLPNRGALVWSFGLIGCSIQLFSVVVALLAILAVDDFLEGMVYGLPGQLIGLAVSIPAWIMGQIDVKAIAAGAMEEGGWRATRWGLRLGIIGTLLGLSQLFLYFSLVIFEEFFA